MLKKILLKDHKNLIIKNFIFLYDNLSKTKLIFFEINKFKYNIYVKKLIK